MAIKLTIYKSISDDLEVGETARVNHDECTAGVDTRRRLYITRPQSNPDAVVAYCHNCQMGGYAKTGTHEAYRSGHHASVEVQPPKRVGNHVGEPPNMIDDLSDWPVDAVAWAFKNRLNQQLVTQYNIQYDPSTNRVYMPRYKFVFGTSCQQLTGYQLRNTTPNINAPKYLTVVGSADSGFTTMRQHGKGAKVSTVAVIVEDLISGIHVVKACNSLATVNVVVYVNYGTKVQLNLLSAAAGIGNALVWLDNDNDHVRKQAETMARTIKLIENGCWTYVELLRCDPKNATYDQIRQHVMDHQWDHNQLD